MDKTNSALSAFKQKRQALAAASLATTLDTSNRQPRRSSAGRQGRSASVTASRRDLPKEGERSWRLGRPGGNTSQRRNGFNTNDPDSTGGHIPPSPLKRLPFVQIFVSPRRSIVGDLTERTSASNRAASDSDTKHATSTLSLATRSSAASTAVSSSIDSARALMSDIGKLLCRRTSVSAPSYPDQGQKPALLSGYETTNPTARVYEEGASAPEHASNTTGNFSDRRAVLADSSSNTRLGIRLHQLVDMVSV
jgi:hypothetical protein